MGMFQDFLGAVMGQESNGNYRAVNPNSGALGLYQVMPANVGPWSKKYLGISVTPSQFLNNASLQTRLVTAVMKDYVNRYGYRGAASAWYSGNPNLASNYNPQKYGPSIGSYVDSVMDRMKTASPAFGMAGGMIGVLDTGLKAVKEGFAKEEASRPEPAPLSEMAVKSILAPSDADKEKDPTAGGLGLDSPLGPDSEGGLGLDALGLEAPTGRSVDDPLASASFSNLSLTPSVGVELSNESDSRPMQLGSSIGGEFSMRSPLPGFAVTFGFGEQYGSTRAAGDYHKGIDFAAPQGTRVYMPEGARIVSAGWENSGFGFAIRYQAADGTFGILGHLASISGGLKAGTVVKAGVFAGRIGSTGDSSGYHLHWEKRRKLYDINTAYDFSDLVEW